MTTPTPHTIAAVIARVLHAIASWIGAAFDKLLDEWGITLVLVAAIVGMFMLRDCFVADMHQRAECVKTCLQTCDHTPLECRTACGGSF